MNAPPRPAAPTSGTDSPAAPASGPNDDSDIPSFEELAADPEIAALLDFESVPVRKKVNGWDADAQRAFVVLLATTGSKLHAATAIGRKVAGMDRILKRPDAGALAAAVDAALAVADRRNGREIARGVADAAVSRARRSSAFRFSAAADEPEPGQVRNEYGEWEDEESLNRRAGDAAESIAGKLLRIRRLYLQEISASPGKRAAFEILTELPIDWEKAAALEPQPDEPYRTTNQRQPDMILTAESGWSFGEFGYGPDKKAEARRAIDQFREEEGLPPVNWEESTERSDAGA